MPSLNHTYFPLPLQLRTLFGMEVSPPPRKPGMSSRAVLVLRPRFKSLQPLEQQEVGR